MQQAYITIPLTSAEAIRHHRCHLIDHHGESEFSEIVANDSTLRFTNTKGAAQTITEALRALVSLGLTVTLRNPDGSAVSLEPTKRAKIIPH